MPIFAFFTVVGLVLLVLLYVAGATLEEGSPPIATSSRVGLPERWHSDTTPVLTTTPAPAPDMSSPAVRAAQPKPNSEPFAAITPAARAARAEAPPASGRSKPPSFYRPDRWSDRFSIGGQ
jgi:hypothetical protein